jgi:hypothetical protein
MLDERTINPIGQLKICYFDCQWQSGVKMRPTIGLESDWASGACLSPVNQGSAIIHWAVVTNNSQVEYQFENPVGRG